MHVGRRDFQVKIRGYRIDVAEVENALRVLPGVGDAVVVGREMEPGVQRLVAYVVAAPELAACTGAGYGSISRSTLPDYMIPSVFVAMDAIPRTPNGKTDRLRLPLPVRARRNVDVPYRAPRTAIEFELAAIWADVLGIEQVGIDDRFLYLGGDSLKAMEIVSRVTELFGAQIPMSMMLGPVTIADMANAIAAARSGGAWPGSPERP